MWAGSVKFVLSDMKREKCSQAASSKPSISLRPIRLHSSTLRFGRTL
jgi:hypothetical protein